MNVSVIIPNYNGLELLHRNLPYVMTAYRNLINRILEVIVVDDMSKDESVRFLKSNYPEIKLIRHKKNRGFSATVNTGVRGSKGNYIVLLNSDVKPSVDFLRNAIPHFENEKVFAVSFAEENFSWAKGFFKNGFVGHEPGKYINKTHETFWVNGGSGIFRRDYWVMLGGMDEKLLSPFYWEDIDLCYRAQKRGLVCLWEPGAKVLHEHEQTVKRLPQKYVRKIRERNQLLFIWKNITSQRLFRKHQTKLFEYILRHPGYTLVFMRALKSLPDVIKARRREKKESKVSDEAIFSKFNAF